MKLTNLSGNLTGWFDGSGPMSGVVISSRIRLARNLAGYKFLWRCSEDEQREILEKLRDAMLELNLSDELFYISVDKAGVLERNFLVERHLISRHHAGGKGVRGAVIAKKEFFAGMINEEDHLRIQVIKSGLQLAKCAEQINGIDDSIEEKVEYAFSKKFGYLTACPTNVGTGVRVSVMLHLPGLRMMGEIKKFFNSAVAMNLAVRGLFGEGTESIGDFYQLSNQATLGVREEQIVGEFEEVIVPKIVEYENAARDELLKKQKHQLNDKIARAMALLENAHLISSHEALGLLSHLRMGVNMHDFMGASTPAIDRLCEKDKGVSIAEINRLFMLTQPAHLQMNCGKALDETGRDILRAKIIHSTLSKN